MHPEPMRLWGRRRLQIETERDGNRISRNQKVKMKQYYSGDRPGLSYELFPPKTEKAEGALFDQLEKLVEFKPDYITCTYGAGGSTQGKTLEIIKQVKARFGVPVASHLTVVGATEEDLKEYLAEAQKADVDFIVALRGDPPEGEDVFRPTTGGLSYANELVELIREGFPGFGIAVAGYPEKHRQAVSLDVDLDHLKRKVDAGADIVITQLFYDNDDFFRFRDLCGDKQINVPIVPGILPVVSLKQIQRITQLCDAKLPADFQASLESADSVPDQLEIGIQFATRQVEELLAQDVCGVHFYVLNKSVSTARILEALDF